MDRATLLILVVATMMQVSEATDSIAVLQEKIEDHQEKIGVQHEEIDELQGNINALQRTIILQSNKIDDLQQIIDSQQQKIDKQQQTIDSKQQKINKKQLKIDEQQQAISEMTSHNQQCQTKLTSIQTDDCLFGRKQTIVLSDERSVSVECKDHELVFQRRNSSDVDFYLPWANYTAGFGDVKGGNFWLGLDTVHSLCPRRNMCQLRVDFTHQGKDYFAKYGNFWLGEPGDNYRLFAWKYAGDAGDALSYHNGRPFSTWDADHDNSPSNCAKEHHGAWWYNSCHLSNLNGRFDVNNKHQRSNWFQYAHISFSMMTLKLS